MRRLRSEVLGQAATKHALDHDRHHEGRYCRPGEVELPRRRNSWWEIEHWADIVDEESIWGDLSLEARLTLKKLLES
jgi:hypothetical protein